MGDRIDTYTKKKPPNAYVLFTNNFMTEYKTSHTDGNIRFRGGLPRAIKDPLVVSAWEGLSLEEKQMWKDRARARKYQMLNEFASHVEQYVSAASATQGIQQQQTASSGPEIASSESADRPPAAAKTPSQQFQEEVSVSPSQMYAASLEAKSANLKRFLRPQKKRTCPGESKYAPTFFEEISTAKQFEEKRRRERECLTNIWTWRYGEDKEGLLKETFFLVSSQSMGVEGDVHVPGTIACVEFSIADGIKREFVCSVSRGCKDWSGATVTETDDTACSLQKAPVYICREIFGTWLRLTHRDLSSKTPVFYCLVDEYTETLDCLAHIYAYKDGMQQRFSPCSLGTVDDLLWCILQYFEVPFTADATKSQQADAQQTPARNANESFPLSRVIDQYYEELSVVHSCSYHQHPSQENAAMVQERMAAGGDVYYLEKRCSLAVVRACAAYAKKWIEDGNVSSEVMAVTGDVAAEKEKKSETAEKEEVVCSTAEGLKPEEIDRISFLALSKSGSGGSVHTLSNDDATLGGGRSIVSEIRSDGSDILTDSRAEQRAALRAQLEEHLKRTADRDAKSGGSVTVGPLSADSVCPVRSSVTCGSGTSATKPLSTPVSVSVPMPTPISMPVSLPTPAPMQVSLPTPAPMQVSTSVSVPLPLPVPGVVPNIGRIENVRGASASATSTVATAGMEHTAVLSSVFTNLWSDEFCQMYAAQLRLPFGARGLGRGIHLGTRTVGGFIGRF